MISSRSTAGSTQGEPFVGALLEQERREHVLAHDPVLDLGGVAHHVNQRLAMLDDERHLGLRPSAARRQDLREATAPGAAGWITHSGAPSELRPRRPQSCAQNWALAECA
jgi:hypothetical protein